MRYDFNLVENTFSWEENGLTLGSGSSPVVLEGKSELSKASPGLADWHKGFLLFWGGCLPRNLVFSVRILDAPPE